MPPCRFREGLANTDDGEVLDWDTSFSLSPSMQLSCELREPSTTASGSDDEVTSDPEFEGLPKLASINQLFMDDLDKGLCDSMVETPKGDEELPKNAEFWYPCSWSPRFGDSTPLAFLMGICEQLDNGLHHQCW